MFDESRELTIEDSVLRCNNIVRKPCNEAIFGESGKQSGKGASLELAFVVELPH